MVRQRVSSLYVTCRDPRERHDFIILEQIRHLDSKTYLLFYEEVYLQ